MSGYNLTYFNGQGRGEVTRILLALADVKYEDIRIELEDWPARKKDINAPFGQMPVFEGDGMTICQSNAIARYLANKYGFAGTTPQEKARADMIVDCAEDMIRLFTRAYWNKDQDARKEELQKFEEEQLPDFLGKFEAILKQYMNGNSFFIVESVTWADIVVFHFIRWIEKWGLGVPLGNFPKIEGFVKRVESQPKLAQWLKDRPDTKL